MFAAFASLMNGRSETPPTTIFHVRSKDRISMVNIRIIRRLALALLILALFVVLPACRTAGSSPPPLVRSPDATTSRFALRPILDGEGYRPYYVAGYAGASYGPGLFSRRSMVGLPTAPGPGIPNVTVEQGTWDPQ
jgi:hypothetical protein